MTKHVIQEWRADRATRSMILSMRVEVNGRVYRQEYAVADDLRAIQAPPMSYIEEKLRGSLMGSIETELFGPR